MNNNVRFRIQLLIQVMIPVVGFSGKAANQRGNLTAYLFFRNIRMQLAMDAFFWNAVLSKCIRMDHNLFFMVFISRRQKCHVIIPAQSLIHIKVA